MSAAPALRLGMIGLDTSHSVEFAQLLNHPDQAEHVAGARITVATPTCSADMPWSADRVEGFTRDMREKHGVQIVDSISKVVAECDAVLLCSLDGRSHLEQFQQCAVGKPVFVDKPISASLRDAREICRIAEETGTPMFSSSALRFESEVREVAAESVGRLTGAISYGPAPIEPTHPDLVFYGLHAAEMLFTVLGTGCQRVSRVTTERASVVTGEWRDGVVGVLYAMHHWPGPYKIVKMGDRSAISRDVPPHYAPLVREIVKFCQSGVPPVSAAQTLELFAFLEAADESKRRGGAAVTLA